MLRGIYGGSSVFWFVVGVLVTWRLTALLCYDDGPFGIVRVLRTMLARIGMAKLLECFHCTSVWIALGVAVALYEVNLSAVLLWWALAGAASFLESLVPGALAGHELEEEDD